MFCTRSALTAKSALHRSLLPPLTQRLCSCCDIADENIILDEVWFSKLLSDIYFKIDHQELFHVKRLRTSDRTNLACFWKINLVSKQLTEHGQRSRSSILCVYSELRKVLAYFLLTESAAVQAIQSGPKNKLNSLEIENKLDQ